MSSPRLRFRAVALYIGAWLPLMALQLAVLRMFEDNLPQALRDQAIYGVPGLALGGIYWSLSSRIRWAGMSWGRIVLIETAMALGFDLLWHTIFMLVVLQVGGAEIARSIAEYSLGWQVISGLTVYTVQAMVFHNLRIARELRRQQVAAAESESARMHAEMLALRGQLDPHFLFNSLHSIVALVREDPRRGEEALLRFSDLLRHVLATKRDSTDEVTVETEMRFVNDYLAIERLRLGDRLRVRCDVAAEALSCRLPAFTLQPLVENSIRHAVAPHREGAALEIDGKVQGNRLELRVRDDGPGADPSALSKGTGVGLSVIRQRLTLMHGAAASLQIETGPGKGFCATICLPAEAI